jgi:hypothetical protein
MNKTQIMRLVAVLLLLVFAGMMFLRNCSSPDKGPKKPSRPDTEKPAEVVVPPFSADSAMYFLKKQVDFGPRVPNKASHVACGDWIVSSLKSFGAKVTEQKTVVNAWDGTPLKIRNIIGSFNPDIRKRVLLAAHWDTRPYADKDPDVTQQKKPIDGANDGASGVAVLLEIARHIQSVPPNVGVDIIFFDAEDYGKPEWDKSESADDYLYWCLGSQYWMNNPHSPGYTAIYGILLDMVGGRDARFNKEGISMQVAPDVVNALWGNASRLGFGSYFQEPVTGEIIDDHIFMNRAGVRTVDIIDMRPSTKSMGFGGYEFGSTHHTHKDDLSNIDPATIDAVGKTVIYTLYHTR